MADTIGSIDGPTHLATVQENAALKTEIKHLKEIICEFIAASELTGFSMSQETYNEARKIADELAAALEACAGEAGESE